MSEFSKKYGTAFGVVNAAGRIPAGVHFSPDDEIDETQANDDEGNEGNTIEHDNGGVGNRGAQSAALQLLADPEVQALLVAKRQGKKVKIVEEDGTTEDDSKTEEDETVDEDPLKGIPENDPLRQTLAKIDQLVTARLGKVVEKVDQMSTRLQGVESVAGNVQRKEVTAQVEETRKKYQDFDKYRDKMLELNKTFPGLGVEELYILARQRAGKLKIDQPSTFSERPTNQPRRLGGSSGKKTQRPPGRKGFDEILNEALSNLDLSSLE